jgi:competence protein ComEA
MTAASRAFPMLVIAGTFAAVVAVALVSRTAGQPSLQVTLPETATATPSDGQMKVYLAGAVIRPGVYPVHPGDRVADVIEAAGGPADDADMLAVNLARRLRDEDQIVVPRQGEGVAAASGDAGGTATAGRPLNINLAPAAALETLPGIGPSRAQHIVESRTKDGPFADVSDLVKRKLVPQSVLDSIKDLIDVRS